MLPRLLRKPKGERIDEMQVRRGGQWRRSWELGAQLPMEDPAKRAGVPLCVPVGGRGILHGLFGQAKVENGEKSL